MEKNTSGHGPFSEVPDEVNKWNWGAFWLTWIWGIGNHVYIALLALLPIANIIMPFYLGKKGNELVWRNTSWCDVEDLQRTQKKWAIAGWIIGLFFTTLTIGNEVTKYQEAKESVEMANKIMEIVMEDKEAKAMIGEEYEIVHNMPVSVDRPMAYDIIIRANGNLYSVYAKIGDNKEIKSVEVSDFGNEGKAENKILIKVQSNNK